ncbi:MAG: nitroreductase family protein [Candidatus Lokiarchaeota archaeon]|nr:nitroreductase family protein [Candidatus Lokiarchaeota archaeon]
MDKKNRRNQTLELIKNRRTIRAYDPKPLSQEEVDTIIHGAMRAPTAGNMMMYSIIQVSDQELKDKLVKTCDNQPLIAKAPLVLLFLADVQRWWDYFKVSKVEEKCNTIGKEFQTPQESDLLLACCDALIAAQNSVIAAEALGIGSCYIGDIMENYEIHREMFNLPRWVFPITLLCYGHPKGDKNKIPLTTRFPRKLIQFTNQYSRLSKHDFEDMLKNDPRRIIVKEAENMGQQMYFGKLGAEFTVEMRRSVKAALNEWLKKD